MTFPWQIVIKPTTLNLLSIIHQNSHIYTSLFFYVLLKFHFLKVEAIASEHHYWNKHNGNSKKVLPVSKRFFLWISQNHGMCWHVNTSGKVENDSTLCNFWLYVRAASSSQSAKKKKTSVWVFWAGVWVKRQKDPHIMKLSEITSHFTQQQLLRRGKKVLVMNFITMK